MERYAYLYYSHLFVRKVSTVRIIKCAFWVSNVEPFNFLDNILCPRPHNPPNFCDDLKVKVRVIGLLSQLQVNLVKTYHTYFSVSQVARFLVQTGKKSFQR